MTPTTATPSAPLLFGDVPPPTLVAGSGDRQPPRVPTVIQFGDPANAYRVPPLTRLPVLYHTPTTVRVQTAKGAASLQPAQVGALPDDAAWEQAQAVGTQYQTALEALAAALRALGRYDKRLGEAAAWRAGQPDPLCPTVIEAKDPDARSWSTWGPRGKPPTVLRHAVDRQTPKMLHLTSDGLSSAALSAQSQYFVCPTDDDWARVAALHKTVRTAAAAWQAFMDRLGTYSAPLPQGPLPPADPALLTPDPTTAGDPTPTDPPTPADPAPADTAERPDYPIPAQPANEPVDTNAPPDAGDTQDFDLGDDAAPSTAPAAEQDADAEETADTGEAEDDEAGGAGEPTTADALPAASDPAAPTSGPPGSTTTDVTGAVVRLTLVLQPSSGPTDERPVLLIAHTAKTTPVVQQVRWDDLAPWPAVLTALLDTLAAQPPSVVKPPAVTYTTTTPPAGRTVAARTPPPPTMPATAPPTVQQLTLFDP